MTPLENAEKVAAARLLVTKYWPYLAVPVLRMSVRWARDPGLRAAVDKRWRLYLNPDWVAETSTAELALVLAGHEVQHLLNRHFLRFDGCHPRKANVAQDLAINSTLDEFCRAARQVDLESRTGIRAAFECPANACYPRDFRDAAGNPFPEKLAAEEYYALLPPVVTIPCYCGSAAGGEPAPWEEEGPDPGGGDVSPAEAEVLIRAAAEDTLRHAARNPGTVPAGLLRDMERVLAPPRVDWRKVLRRAVRASLQRTAGDWDHTWRKPTRRPAGPVLLPSRQAYRPTAAAVVDTSGSMTKDLVLKALAEVAGVAAALGAPLPVISCDAVAAPPVVCKDKRDVRLVRLVGGGGTNMGAGIAAAAALRPTPDLIVVVTDGYTPYACDRPPNSRVLVAVVGGDPTARYPVPPWAEAVILEGVGED